MTARLPSASLLRFWALLLLAVIGLQAALPPVAAFELSHGSAFSADTYEVAVARQRTDESRDSAVVPLPLDPWLHPDSPSEIPLLRWAAAAAPQFVAVAAPSDRSRFWRPATRAPPLA